VPARKDERACPGRQFEWDKRVYFISYVYFEMWSQWLFFLTEWKHNQHQPSLSAATFLRLEHLSSGWKSPWPPWIPPNFVGVCKIPVIDLTGLTMVFHPNIHGLINPINFPTNPWVKNLRQQIPNPSVIEPGLSWAALKGPPGWSGRTTTKWVCLKIYWLKWSLNAENDD